MKFNFEPKQGTGIAKLIPNVSPDVQEIISKMLTYDQAFRISANQVLKLPYFRDLREADKTLMDNQSISTNPAMRMTKKANESFSQHSKR